MPEAKIHGPAARRHWPKYLRFRSKRGWYIRHIIDYLIANDVGVEVVIEIGPHSSYLFGAREVGVLPVQVSDTRNEPLTPVAVEPPDLVGDDSALLLLPVVVNVVGVVPVLSGKRSFVLDLDAGPRVNYSSALSRSCDSGEIQRSAIL